MAGDVKRMGEEEKRGEAGWLVRWQVCSSGLPGMVRGSFHLSKQSSSPEPGGRLPQSPLGNRITLIKNLLSLLKFHRSN